MATLYTPKHAAQLLSVSASAVRLYTNTYNRHLSTEATSNPRRFTEADLRFIAYVVSQTTEGKAHERILTHLATDEGKAEYDQFEWESPETATVDETMSSTMLVPVERLVATQALLQAQLEERQRLLDRERELLDQVNQLQRELGKAEGKIDALEATRQAAPQPAHQRSWWARMFIKSGDTT